uniref:G-patch domain-containing protein n=2 Tax=Tetranychus urticae TaxID=32264 RepID=T1L1N0_TETUR
MKMGYKLGDGLGKHGQGIKTPIIPGQKSKLSTPIVEPEVEKKDDSLKRSLHAKKKKIHSLKLREQRLMDRIKSKKESGELLKKNLARVLNIYHNASVCVKSWKPLENPDAPFGSFKEYRTVLLSLDIKYYDILMWDIWLPIVESAISDLPSIRTFDPVINLLETWKALLQDWLLEYILNQLVGTRLKDEIIRWDPLNDPVPIHFWIHPWLPLMADKLEPIFAPLRQKLAAALVQWHPKDRSAKMILKPWKYVFLEDIWSTFLLNNIVPKLEVILQSLVINPHQQILDLWNWFIDWEDMLPIEITVDLLVRIFFPKWLHILYEWLRCSPNYDEVSRWYLGWKTMFSDNLRNQIAIQKAFKKALEMMNHAVTDPGGILTYQHNLDFDQPNATNVPTPVQTLEYKLYLTFEELIDLKATELAVPFTQFPNSSYDNKSVYKFGKFSIYFENDVIYCKNNDSWNPISLEDLCNRVINCI